MAHGDGTKVARVALKNAASIPAPLLTAEVVSSDGPEASPAAGPPRDDTDGSDPFDHGSDRDEGGES